MTIPALPIHLRVQGDEVVVGLGSHAGRRIVGKINHGHVEVTVPTRGMQQAAPYHFQLSRWTQGGIPCLRTHPVAILHLLITGQCNRAELRDALPRFIPGVPGIIMPIERPCALLNMLGVPRANLGFASTTADFNVGQSPS
ncbi:MAG TPA: hypothetical protein VJM46_01230 [Candidatus Saccharimonadales bacterium]|nr:hypothetical protein [Candidatus Saccharimonadales bacterium]